MHPHREAGEQAGLTLDANARLYKLDPATTHWSGPVNHQYFGNPVHSAPFVKALDAVKRSAPTEGINAAREALKQAKTATAADLEDIGSVSSYFFGRHATAIL